MNSQEIFKNKYLKYKSKYFSLKKQIGGVFSEENMLQHLYRTQDLSQAFLAMGPEIYIGLATQLNYIIELSVDGNEVQQMWANLILNLYNDLGAPAGPVTPPYLREINAIFRRASNIRERLPPRGMSTSRLSLTDLRHFLYVRSGGLTKEEINVLGIDALRQLVLRNWANVFSD